jgi:hypothetical protein
MEAPPDPRREPHDLSIFYREPGSNPQALMLAGDDAILPVCAPILGERIGTTADALRTRLRGAFEDWGRSHEFWLLAVILMLCVALALTTDVHTLLVAPLNHEGEPFFRVLRKNDRRPVERAESAFGYRYEALGSSAGGASMLPFLVHLPREIDRHVFFEHDGEEFVHLLVAESFNGFFGLPVESDGFLFDGGFQGLFFI